jgi:hypothetical protein
MTSHIKGGKLEAVAGPLVGAGDGETRVVKLASDDALRALAAARAEIDRLTRRVAELEQAKWEVKHVDTMNDMVAMGMARDAAEAKVERIRMALEQIEVVSYADSEEETIARQALRDTADA